MRGGVLRVVTLNCGSTSRLACRRPRERAALAFHEPITGVLASDHFGLVVDVRWPDRQPC